MSLISDHAQQPLMNKMGIYSNISAVATDEAAESTGVVRTQVGNSA